MTYEDDSTDLKDKQVPDTAKSNTDEIDRPSDSSEGEDEDMSEDEASTTASENAETKNAGIL
jgi:hypothetical protein